MDSLKKNPSARSPSRWLSALKKEKTTAQLRQILEAHPDPRPELKLPKTSAPTPILPELDFRNFPQLGRPFRPELRRSFSRIHGPQLVHARPRQLEFSDFFSRLSTLSPTLAASEFAPGLAPSLSSLSRFPSPRLPQLPVRSPA
ncbi:hypothetical protein CRG98_018692 [Punica granatum]|uniref:Uncharacterized protein n=1 Tax=Punica granatum TaxID=22663 RepID=A0A2I0JXA2_PUNGR|nr:hypothetical protein CRG98_018692 [Punica granatum]